MPISYPTRQLCRDLAVLIIAGLVLMFLVSMFGCRSYSFSSPDGPEVTADIFGTNSQIGTLHAETAGGDKLIIENLSMEERLTTLMGQMLAVMGAGAAPAAATPPARVVVVPEAVPAEEEAEAEPEPEVDE